MDLKNFKLIHEDDKSYHVQHPNGRHMSVSKEGLSDKAHAMIKKLACGGPVKMKDGGQTVRDTSNMSDEEIANQPALEDDETQVDNPSQQPININIDASQPDRSPASTPAASPFALSPEQAQAVQKYVAPTQPALPPNDPYVMAQAQKAEQQANLMKSLAPAAPAAPAPAAPSQAAPQAPAAPDRTALNAMDINKAMEAEKAANLAGANAVSGQGALEQKSIQAIQDKIDAMPTQQELVDANRQKNMDLFQAYADKKIEPNQFWHNASTGSKIAAGIGLFLGGMSTPFTHQANPAIGIMQAAVDRDIMAQKNEQGKAHNLWTMNREMLGTDMAANLATQNQLYTGLKYQLMSAAAQFQGPIAKANAQRLNAQIDQQIAMNNFKLSLMQGPTQEAMDPATHIGMLQKFGLSTPEQTAGALKEVKDRENISTNEPKIFAAFDEATKQHLTDYIPGTENAGQMALKQLLLPNFKNIDGTVRQAAMDETFNNVVPRFGDSSGKIAAKRQALQDWITSEKAAPISKSIGVDLDKYPSTKETSPLPRVSNAVQQKVQIFMKQNPQVKDPNQALQILKKAGKI